jgi:hypothetical protein
MIEKVAAEQYARKPEAGEHISVRFDSQLVGVGVHCRIGLGQDPYKAPEELRGMETSLPLASTYGIEHLLPVGPDWSNDVSLAAPVNLELKHQEFVPIRDPEPPLAPPDLAPLAIALDALESITPFDVIGDAFAAASPLDVKLTGSLGDALATLARSTAHNWWKQDGFVMMKSKHYASDRQAEPPIGFLIRYAKEMMEQPITIDGMAEVATLSPRQAWHAERMMVHMHSRRLTPFFMRHHFVFWNSLSPPQKTAALNTGLAYTDLTNEQRELFVLASTGRIASREPGAARNIPWTRETLQLARYRVLFRSTSMWGYAKGDSSAYGNYSSRELALAGLRRLKPDLQLDDVRNAVKTDLTFDYGIVTDQMTGGSYSFTQYRIR